MTRRLKLQVQTSIDGYMADTESNLSFLTYPWTDDINAYVTALMEGVDTMILGRNLADGFIPAWESRSSEDAAEQASIDWMINTPKVIVSNTLNTAPRENTTIASGDLVENVQSLKGQDGGDLIAYGGYTLVHGLIGAGLVDDIYLFVNPNAIGEGKPVFPATGLLAYQLVEAKPFECGITALRYQPKAAE